MGDMGEFTKFLKKQDMEQKEEVKETWTQWKTDKSVVMVFRAKGEMGTILDTFESGSEAPDVQKILKQYSETGREVKVSVDLMKQLLKLLAKTDSETITIRVDKDYPVFFGTKDFEIILAPRVEED